MEPVIGLDCSPMECTSLSPSAPIWQDILAQAMTGELLAAMNYASLSEICDDPAEVADALEHAQGGASPRRAALRRQGLPAASGCDDHPRADAGEGMQGWTLRSVPRQLCEAITVRSQLVCSRASRSVAATVSEDARHAGDTRGGNTWMGSSVASVDRQGRTTEVDFALIGHPESWRAAADILAVLRGPER